MAELKQNTVVIFQCYFVLVPSQLENLKKLMYRESTSSFNECGYEGVEAESRSTSPFNLEEKETKKTFCNLMPVTRKKEGPETPAWKPPEDKSAASIPEKITPEVRPPLHETSKAEEYKLPWQPVKMGTDRVVEEREKSVETEKVDKEVKTR